MQTSGQEVMEDWSEERTRQVRLQNLAKAREAAKLKREQQSGITLVPLPTPVEPVMREKKRKLEEDEQPVYLEDTSKRAKRDEPPVSVPLSTKLLTHMGSFLLTAGAMGVSIILPMVIQAYTDSLKHTIHIDYPEARGQREDARGNGVLYGQSIFK